MGYLIIIEGPDRTGKSTLAERLRTRAEEEPEVWHRGAPTRHPLQEYVLEMERFLPRRLVVDRWHVGQYVYPRLYPDGRVPLSREELLWIDLFLLSRGGYLVRAYDFHDAIAQRVAADPDSYLQAEDAQTCLRLFQEAWNLSLLPSKLFRLGQTHPHEVLLTAEVFYKMYGNHERWPYVIGNTYNPQLLLVGDRLGRPNPPDATHEVPFAPYAQSSGHYLMRALINWTRTDQRTTAIVNSLRPDGEPEQLLNLWRELGRPLVVALGRKAQKRVEKQLGETPFGTVPHPQWVRRFHHDKLAEYSLLIQAAAYRKTDMAGYFPVEV